MAVGNGLAPETELSSTDRYIQMWKNRTPEEFAAIRSRIYAHSPEPRELPEGMTLEDVIVGQWPGDETDEEIDAALRELS